MKIANAQQMAAIDKRTMEEWGVSGALLMESAGRATAYAIAERWGAEVRVAVLCGPGNNGGDGFCIARTLSNLGYEVTCFSAIAMESYRGDALMERRAWQLAGGKVEHLQSWKERSSEFGLAVDALFGTGLQRPLEGIYGDAIDILNESGMPVVAVDIPSGVSCNTGAVLGIAPRCQLTVTMGLPKPGLFIYPGRELAGERLVAELGFARQLLTSSELEGEVLDEGLVQSLWRCRLPHSHKGTHGCTLVIGGSSWYYGAPLLAAEGALRAGTGLCLWGAPRELVECRPFAHREVMVWPLPSSQGFLGMEAWEELEGGILDRCGGVSGRSLPRIDAILIGPGLGREPESAELLKKLLEKALVPIVVDADALHLLPRKRLSARVILTPHRGEMAALLGCSVADVEGDLLMASRRAAELYGATVILKGVPTVICSGANYWLSDASVPVLAQGGTGDVLAGIVAALLAQGHSLEEAACLGVYLHVQAGKRCAASVGPRGIFAGEIAAAVPQVCASVESGRLKKLCPRVCVSLGR